jgi:hypothetical protein
VHWAGSAPHSAAEAEHSWPFCGQLLGGDAWFTTHPTIQTAAIDVERPLHPSTKHLPASFDFADIHNSPTEQEPACAGAAPLLIILVIVILLNIDRQFLDIGTQDIP